MKSFHRKNLILHGNLKRFQELYKNSSPLCGPDLTPNKKHEKVFREKLKFVVDNYFKIPWNNTVEKTLKERKRSKVFLNLFSLVHSSLQEIIK